MAVLDFPGVAVLPDNEQEGKLRRDFHPAQLLLVSLNDICPRGPPPKPSDPPPNPNESLEEMFHTFVNKIALICDFEPKGDTITAVAVIWYNAKITYTLASNQRGPGALNNVRKGLTEVLNILKANLEAPSKQPDHVIEERLMDRILWWNKVRVRSYLTTLSKELESCMKRCDINTPEGREAKEALAKLAEVAPDLNKGGQKTETYIASTIQFIRVIQASRKLKTFLHRYISSRSAEDHTMGKGGSWSNLQHVAGRLLAYRYAVEVLVHAHHMWANTDLFRDFEIEAVRSSIPYLPEAKVLNPTPESVEMILNRMPGPRKKKEALMKDAKVLDEKYYLGIELQRRWKDQFRVKTPPPQKDGQKGTKADATAAVPLKAELELKPTRIVHAEILLHSWLLATEGGVQPARFFQGWQYIGTSKPPCRMCTEYLSFITPTPVQTRKGHPNTYLNWRLPDPYTSAKQTDKAKREKDARIQWCQDLGKMKAWVFEAVGSVLVTKVAEWKRWDSNTYTSKVKSVKGGGQGGQGGQEGGAVGGAVGMLAGWLGGMGLGG